MKTQTRTRTSAIFTGADGKDADPYTTTLTVTGPGGVTIYTYGSGADITRDAQGRYSFEHVPPAGNATWRYDWLGVGDVDARDAVEVLIKDP